MCIWSTIIDQYIWKNAIDLSIVFVWNCAWWDKPENGWVVKKYNFFFLTALNLSECILMVSLYIWLSIYTNNETLRIIWKFDLSSRGGLGRIYALSIEVLSSFDVNSEDSDQTAWTTGWSESSLAIHYFCWFCYVAAHFTLTCVSYHRVDFFCGGVGK